MLYQKRLGKAVNFHKTTEGPKLDENVFLGVLCKELGLNIARRLLETYCVSQDDITTVKKFVFYCYSFSHWSIEPLPLFSIIRFMDAKFFMGFKFFVGFKVIIVTKVASSIH